MYFYHFLFSFGEEGWHLDKEGNKSIYTTKRFYRYKFFHTSTEFSTIVPEDRIYQQFIYDQYLNVKQTTCKSPAREVESL